MQLPLSKRPWRSQLLVFLGVCVAGVGAFYYDYVLAAQADLTLRRSHLTTLQRGVARGIATASRLPELQSQVGDLQQRLEILRAVLPEEKDVADILRRLQGLAAQSNLSIQRFTPQPSVPQAMYAEVPFKLQAEGTYHNLGGFFGRISSFPRIINISDISIKTKPRSDGTATIIAECVATTFVLQDGGNGLRANPTAPSRAPTPK